MAFLNAYLQYGSVCEDECAAACTFSADHHDAGKSTFTSHICPMFWCLLEVIDAQITSEEALEEEVKPHVCSWSSTILCSRHSTCSQSCQSRAKARFESGKNLGQVSRQEDIGICTGYRPEDYSRGCNTRHCLAASAGSSLPTEVSCIIHLQSVWLFKVSKGFNPPLPILCLLLCRPQGQISVCLFICKSAGF